MLYRALMLMGMTDSEHEDQDLRQLQQELIHWHCWRGIAGLYYARRNKSSPPVVFRGYSVQELREQIREWMTTR